MLLWWVPTPWGQRRTSLLLSSRFSSFGEGGATVGTIPAGADRVGIGAAIVCVGASAGAVHQDGTVGAGQFIDRLASTGRVAADRASIDLGAVGPASTGRVAVDLAPTDQAAIGPVPAARAAAGREAIAAAAGPRRAR